MSRLRPLDQPLVLLFGDAVAAACNFDQLVAIQDADVAARRFDGVHAFEDVQLIGVAGPPDTQLQRQEFAKLCSKCH
ncbi:hypothetical protein HFN80_17355 [Rhizobium laguerreae]|nr:hypothetical protein [Rhizobium laguerreae]MBY3465754.1 hypothetical protein [Rhizobium laguerreae]